MSKKLNRNADYNDLITVLETTTYPDTLVYSKWNNDYVSLKTLLAKYGQKITDTSMDVNQYPSDSEVTTYNDSAYNNNYNSSSADTTDTSSIETSETILY